MSKFIWLDPKRYPDFQKGYHTIFAEKDDCNYALAEFEKKYAWNKKVNKIEFDIFADCKYELTVNGEVLGIGPTPQGGDYAFTKPLPIQYYDTYVLSNIENKLDFYVRVQLQPDVMSDVSCGQGCLWVRGKIFYEDGTCEAFGTDESWIGRIAKEAIHTTQFDFTLEPDEWKTVVEVESIWNLKESNLRLLEGLAVFPRNTETVEPQKIHIDFEKIYAGYLNVEIEAVGPWEMRIEVRETAISQLEPYVYSLKGNGSIDFKSMRMNSIGEIDITWDGEVYVRDVYIRATHYPIALEGSFRCSDDTLNRIYELGKHTVDICRQGIELDSPHHQETLGCVGDYAIESLIAYYCFGDYSLTRQDITRIAEYLRATDGKMFHTSYSLIWIQMLYDYYLYSGEQSLLIETEDVLDTLMQRFHSYIGATGVIEYAPNYMFLDWVDVDEFTLHHPPKVLGQATLSAQYYGALQVAAKIYQVLEKKDKSAKCQERQKPLKNAFRSCFYDEKKKVFQSGLGTSSDTNEWLPQNVNRRYYIWHANIFAVLYGLCEGEEAHEIMERILQDDSMVRVEIYGMHFLLEAIYKAGLFETYGMELIQRWTELVNECEKGMREGLGSGTTWAAYIYDYSHGWGCTPTYQLPSKISGLQILEPGFKRISLNPNLCNLEWAEMEIPTPQGKIKLRLGENSYVELPQGIELV